MNKVNPYKGIYSYTVKDKDLFWGRDKEIYDFTESILSSTSVILAGYSGCGKTSLIKAGILPKLSEYDYHVITITPRDVYDYERRNRFSLDFWEKINKEIEEQWLDFSKNKMLVKLKMKSKLDDVFVSPGNSLWEKLFLCNFCDEEGFVHNFVLVLDQFEEIFQLDLNIKEIEKFFKIYEILCGSYNPSYTYLDELMSIDEKEGNEYKTINVQDDYSLFPKNNKKYSCNNDSFITYNRFLISVRKDFLYDLQSYSRKYPVLSKNIKYVEHLTDDQAKIVIDHCFPEIKEDSKKFNSKRITECIVQQSDFNNTDGETDYYVDTLTLSVVMYKLWEECDLNASTQAWISLLKFNIQPGTNAFEDKYSQQYVEEIKNEIKTINEKDFDEKFKTILNDFYKDRIDAIKNEGDVRLKEKKRLIKDILKNTSLDFFKLDDVLSELFEDVKNISFDGDDSVYEELVGSILDRRFELTEYGTFNDYSVNNETETKDVKKEIVNILKKYSLTDIINRCHNSIVKDRLFQNVDHIIFDLQEKLLSDSGLYRQSLYMYEIGKIFDKYVYGDVDFKDIKEWVIKGKNGIYRVRNGSKLAKIFNDLEIDFMQFKIDNSFAKAIDVLFDENKSSKEKEKSEKECRQHFNRIIYGVFKDKNKDDIKNIREEIVGVIKNCKLFVELNKGGKESMLEYRHDRLCEMAKEYMEIYKVRQNNAKRYTPDVYFTLQGRLKENNCFVDCIFGPWNTYSSIMSTMFFMEGDKSSIVDFDTDSINQLKRINYDQASSAIVTVALNERRHNDKEDYHDFPAYFTHFRVKIEDDKIYNISFEARENYDSNIKKIVIPTGFHKVRFYYDKYDRIVLKEFCVRKEVHKEFYETEKWFKNYKGDLPLDVRITLPEVGYNAIYYRYPEMYSKFPSETFYLYIKEAKKNDLRIKARNEKKMMGFYRELDKEIEKIKVNNFQDLKALKYLTRHGIDGNFGFKSEYDIYGREEYREFIGGTYYGFNKICLKYDDSDKYSNSICFMSLFDKDIDNKVNRERKVAYHYQTITQSKSDSKVHKIELKYEKNGSGRIHRTKYYDTDGFPCMDMVKYIAGEVYTYDDDLDRVKELARKVYKFNNVDDIEGPSVTTEFVDLNENKIEDDKGVKTVILRKNKEGNRVKAIESFGINNNRVDGRGVMIRQKEKMYHRIEFKYYKYKFKSYFTLAKNQSFIILKGKQVPVSQDLEQIKRITLRDKVSFNMILVNGGEFEMGHNIDGEYKWPEAAPAHKVRVNDFYIGETTVTVGLWRNVMNDSIREVTNELKPIVDVSWNDAHVFIEKLNKLMASNHYKFRLPTEAEWEYAARGGVHNKYGYKYSGSNFIDDVAVYTSRERVSNPREASEVKNNAPNRLGIYDMSGNVKEWCEDIFGLYADKTDKIVDNPIGPSIGYSRVLRGGGFPSHYYTCRVYHRDCAFPTTSRDYIGFRLVLEVEN